MNVSSNGMNRKGLRDYENEVSIEDEERERGTDPARGQQQRKARGRGTTGVKKGERRAATAFITQGRPAGGSASGERVP